MGGVFDEKQVNRLRAEAARLAALDSAGADARLERAIALLRDTTQATAEATTALSDGAGQEARRLKPAQQRALLSLGDVLSTLGPS